jgi:hypothetical protein
MPPLGFAIRKLACIVAIVLTMKIGLVREQAEV